MCQLHCCLWKGQKVIGFPKKFVHLCSEDVLRVWTTWGRVINDRNIFGLIIPLIHVVILMGKIKWKNIFRTKDSLKSAQEQLRSILSLPKSNNCLRCYSLEIILFAVTLILPLFGIWYIKTCRARSFHNIYESTTFLEWPQRGRLAYKSYGLILQVFIYHFHNKTVPICVLCKIFCLW